MFFMEETGPKPKNKKKELLKFAVKILVSGVALYFVFQKVNFAETWEALKKVKVGWFLLAFLTFNLSKISSTFRFKSFLSQMEVEITHGYNIRLYFIGAFYNMFLPGSVGGDGYKVYLLKQRFDKATKQFISVAFLDRLSGVAVLFFLTGLMVLMVEVPEEWFWFRPAVIAGLVLCFPVYYVVLAKGWSTFKSAFWETTLYSFITQSGQVLFAFLLLKSLGVGAEEFSYLVLFMVAGVFSVVPITLGGLGAREMVFTFAPDYLPVSGDVGVALAFLVFVTVAVSSFVGFFLQWLKNE